MALMKKVLVALLACFLLLPVASAGETLEKPSLEIGDWWKYECSYETEFEILGQKIDIKGDADVTVCIVASISIDGEDYWEMKIVGEGKAEYKIMGKRYDMNASISGLIYIKKSDFSLLKSDVSINPEIEGASSPGTITTTFDPPLDIMEYPVEKEDEWTSNSTIKNEEYGDYEINLKGEWLGIGGNICTIKHTDEESGNYSIERWRLDLGVPEKVMYFDKNHAPIFTAQLIPSCYGKVEGAIADFEWDPENPTIDNQVQFTDKSTDNGKIKSWLWEFGDGVKLNGKYAKHLYTKEGTYTVNLTVSKNVKIPGTDIEIEIKNTTSRKIEISGNKTTSTPGFEFVFVMAAILILLFNKRFRK